VEGEWTMHFPGRGKAVLKPGMVATIRGGSFYPLENRGGPMVLRGSRPSPREEIEHTNYEPWEDIRQLFHYGPLR
jgi:hypothetical protein